MTNSRIADHASKGGMASSSRPFRDNPGAASSAAKLSWAKLTPEERSARAKNASSKRGENAVPWFERKKFKGTEAAKIAKAQSMLDGNIKHD